MDSMVELARRVEALEGPDREVDCLIAGAVGYEQGGTEHPASYYISEFGVKWLLEQASRLQSIFHLLPRYTASLDAAMTLVPEGDVMFAMIGGRAFAGVGAVRTDDDTEAATLPLALTAAALRAMIAKAVEEGGD